MLCFKNTSERLFNSIQTLSICLVLILFTISATAQEKFKKLRVQQ